jgi:hypothetical protein
MTQKILILKILMIGLCNYIEHIYMRHIFLSKYLTLENVVKTNF